MRKINYIVIHCAATKPSADIGAAEIRKWHVEGNGWRDIGYHFVIRRNGTVEDGRPVEQIGAHVSGHNADSIGICLAGGLDETGRAKNSYTPEQWKALKTLVATLKTKYANAKVTGHRDFPGVKKDCPCFDAQEWAFREGL
ncbi:MAG: N-acetylmuramoyl-L-alanine amidase [Candidatus Adiutrix sp.]|jgi:N-acetyl-anhydromuramyl-L-alanine amidase AmpD|nr:N-acetylmuramoyl-L-alanine amidase [Candidatus Adiutrix sp.]